MLLITLLFLVVVGGGACIVAFLVARLFLPVRSALLFAPIVMASGLIGAAGAFLVQFSLLPRTLTHGWQIIAFFGILAAGALANAVFTGWLFIRLREIILARREVTRRAAVFE